MIGRMRMIALVGLALSTSSCGLYFSKLQFVNGTNSRVADLTVSDGRKTWKLGDLDHGERVSFSGHLAGEGGATIAWTWRGERFTGEGCYYTDGSPAKGTITIAGKELLYRCE